MGDDSARVALGVGMLKVTMLWSWRYPENRASGGMGPCDLVLCATGSGGGREGAMSTLGGGAPTCGGGVSAKRRRRGAAGTGRGGRLGVRLADPGGMEGVRLCGGDMGGDATLGGVLLCTLGGAGGGRLA